MKRFLEINPLPHCSYTIQIIVLKIAVRIKVETNQYSDDFCIRHHTLAVPFGRIITIWKYFFANSFSSSLQKSSAMQKISVILSLLIISNLFFVSL